jgi:hypothetical protein
MPFYDTTAHYDSGLHYDDPTLTAPTRMAQIKIDFARKTPEQLIAIFTEIINAMTGNASYPTPNPALATLIAARDSLQAHINDVKAKENAWHAAIVGRDSQADNAIAAFTLLSAYIQNASGGDEAKILSSGYQVRAAAGAPQPVGAPGNVRATNGDNTGEIDLMWDPEKNAGSYAVDCREHTDPPNWQPAKTVKQSRVTIPGLTPGKEYAFRVRAIGPLGEGPWSDEAVKRAI